MTQGPALVSSFSKACRPPTRPRDRGGFPAPLQGPSLLSPCGSASSPEDSWLQGPGGWAPSFPPGPHFSSSSRQGTQCPAAERHGQEREASPSLSVAPRAQRNPDVRLVHRKTLTVTTKHQSVSVPFGGPVCSWKSPGKKPGPRGATAPVSGSVPRRHTGTRGLGDGARAKPAQHRSRPASRLFPGRLPAHLLPHPQPRPDGAPGEPACAHLFWASNVPAPWLRAATGWGATREVPGQSRTERGTTPGTRTLRPCGFSAEPEHHHQPRHCCG